jgi:hypothetical protein
LLLPAPLALPVAFELVRKALAPLAAVKFLGVDDFVRNPS